jgi:hypothetical protein
MFPGCHIRRLKCIERGFFSASSGMECTVVDSATELASNMEYEQLGAIPLPLSKSCQNRSMGLHCLRIAQKLRGHQKLKQKGFESSPTSFLDVAKKQPPL